MRITLLTIAFCTLLSVAGFSTSNDDSDVKKMGLMTSIQSTHSDIVLPFRTSFNSLLGPAVSVFYAEGAGTDLGLGILYKKYQNEVAEHAISSFWSLRTGFYRTFPDTGDNTTDWVFGVGYGADYYFHTNMALGAEAQLNVVKSDENSLRFGNPGGVNINTAASLTLSIFF